MNPLDHIEISAVCDLCGSDISKNRFRVAAGQQDLLGVAIPLSTVACRRCCFVFQPERFSDTLLAALYEHDTSFDFGGSERESPVIQSCLAERRGVISAALTDHRVPPGATVLDIGGGRGECCQHLVPQYRVVVADTTKSPPVDPRMGKVQSLNLSTVGPGTVDVAVMNHVLEHVFSPFALLASAHNTLREGGILIAEVPFELYTPLVARHLGDWRHVAYFCRATVRQFLEETGFAVEQIVLKEGCYGARRLPVIRAVARRLAALPTRRDVRNSLLALAADMIQPSVVLSLLRSRVARA